MKERDSGIELLRILLMFFVVILHYNNVEPGGGGGGGPHMPRVLKKPFFLFQKALPFPP